MGDGARRHPVLPATAISALLSAVYLVWQPPSLDLAAQVFRADLWDRSGWVLWNDAWYSGHSIPGYSVLYPPLGAWLGPELLGALCAVASAALFAAIASRAYGERAWLGAAWFGAASTVALYGGRTTFALGLVLGLAAMLALQRGRGAAAVAAAAAAGLASPVAGLFTALAAGAVLAARGPRDRLAAATAAAALLTTLALALAFPTDGFQPFAFTAWIWIPLVAIAALLLLPAEERVLRWGVVLYAALGIAAFAVETPVGGNAVRLGATFAGPLLALALYRRRPLALALLALPLLWWQWTATVRDVAAADGDPSTEAAYYEPLTERLALLPGLGRVQIPPTRNRWESVHVAPSVPLARGWLRQLESDDIEQFTDGNLDPAGYAQWLDRHGVAYVAVPDAELDYIAEDEVALIEEGDLPFLREVWSGEHWRLFEVGATDGSPAPRGAELASGGARVRLGPQESFEVRVPGPGEYLLDLRYSPYFTVEEGDACLEDEGDASTRLTTEETGPQAVEVVVRMSLGGLLRRDRVCSE